MPTRTRSLAALLLLVTALVVGASACGSSDGSSSTATTDASGIQVADAWVRATPAGATTGAAYMTISAPDGDRLVAASVPTSVAGVTQIHETVMAHSSTDTTAMDDMSSDTTAMEHMSSDTTAMGGGMGEMTMREVAGIDIPAGGSVELKPGSYHIMLLELVAPLTVGETVPVTLTFEKAGTVVVEAPVRES